MREKYPRHVWMRICLLACLFVCLFSGSSVAETVRNEDYDNERLIFDSRGNLQMTTRDKIATGGVRYRTIGWTIRRLPDALAGGQSARIRLTQTGSRQDPSDPDYVYTYFMCGTDQIFTQIGAVSEEWQVTLYQNGGMVYLDAIMTVVENGRACGSMDADGTLHGEVYTTAEGIMGARGWADPETLRTHYNKALYFPPVPGLIDAPGRYENSGTLRVTYGKKECRKNEVSVQAAPLDTPAFDVTEGIPTGEEAYVRGSMQKFYFDAEFTNVYGVMDVPVTIDVTYTYPVQTENGVGTASFTSPVTVYVQRQYSYYRLSRLDFFALTRVQVKNDALEQQTVTFTDVYRPELALTRERGTYLIVPQAHTAVYGGDLSSGACITMEELRQIAEQTAGELRVRNDLLSIDGTVVSDGAYYERKTPEPFMPHGVRAVQLCSDAILIPDSRANGSYATEAVAYYSGAEDVSGEIVCMDVPHTGGVVVHTPVVCKGGISDDRAHNQQVTPTAHLSLVLGRSFRVGVSTYGTHLDLTGYGTRDYGKYTDYWQIRFPFEVYAGDRYFAENTWITMNDGVSGSFYLPVGVHEGDYRIRYRTVAKNAVSVPDGAERMQYLANLSQENYAAYDELTVTVIGRMYDLAITDIVDYPRWKQVFYGADGQKNGFSYRVGRKNLEGDETADRASDGIFPVLAGSHPFNPRAHAVGLGYTVRLQLLTIGDMRGDAAGIRFTPTYAYVSRDGSVRRQVRLYRKSDLTEVYEPLVLTAENRSYLPVTARNVKDALLQAQSVQVWSGDYRLSSDLLAVDASVDLDAYIRAHGGRLRADDRVFLQNGYLLVRFSITSYRDGVRHLSYCNTANAARGYCNMWELQGFVPERTDATGARFTFLDGDCLLFDMKYDLHSDYESWGTH